MNEVYQHTVRTLTCKRDLEMAIRAYSSFLDCTRQNIKLVIHTDGTLDKSEIERLYATLPGIEVVDRNDTDEQVSEALSKYPKCLEFRRKHPLSNKLLDIPVLENSCIKFIDCDILFLKPFDGFFSEDCGSRFCKETECGYSGRLLELRKVSKNQIPVACNTGIFQINKNKVDFDYIEWFLSNEKLCTYLGLVEQTLYAIFLGYKDAYNFRPDQISTSKDSIDLQDQTVAIHFMYSLKNRFFEYADKYKNINNGNVEQIKLTQAQQLTYPYILKRVAKRYI